MTAQRCEELICKYEQIHLEGLHLYAVVTGSPSFGNQQIYQFSTIPRATTLKCSALWRGYVGHYLLDESGHFYLKGFEYPFGKHDLCDLANEKILGDFYLVFAENFYGDRIYVPFRDGVIISDESHWLSVNKGRNRQAMWLDKDAKFLKENDCQVVIDFGPNSLNTIRQYAVYINGNVARTRSEDSAPKNSLMIRVKQGKHRIVVRETDYKKNDRKESQTLHFSLSEAEIKEFNFRLVDQTPVLVAHHLNR